MANAAPDDPGVELLEDVANELMGGGQFARALEVFLAVEALVPGHYVGPMGAADCLAGLGRTDEALEAATRASLAVGHTRGTLAWTSYRLGQCCLALGRIDDAVSCFADAGELAPHGGGQQAVALLRQFAERPPRNDPALCEAIERALARATTPNPVLNTDAASA